MEEAWTVNLRLAVRVPAGSKWQKSLQQAFNSKIAGSFGLRPKLGGPVYHNNIVQTLTIHLCSSHIGQVLRLSGAVSPDVLHFAALRITLTVPEVVGTENWVTSNLPFLLYPSSIAKMQSESLLTDSRFLIDIFESAHFVMHSNSYHLLDPHLRIICWCK